MFYLYTDPEHLVLFCLLIVLNRLHLLLTLNILNTRCLFHVQFHVPNEIYISVFW